ncbi:MAG: pyridoxal phosphate-dependent aminotransferase [Methanobacteriota archaeon]
MEATGEERHMLGTAKKAERLTGQAAFKTLARARELERKGVDVLHFEIGEPDGPSPPHVVEAAKKALDGEYTHYIASSGIPELREAVRDEVEAARGFRPDMDQVLITPGANPIIYFAASVLMEQDDEVILPDPGFMSYQSVFNYLGVPKRGIRLREDNKFRMSPADVEAAISPKTKLIVMNSPQNPTGSVMTGAEVEEMADIAERSGSYLLSDEIYGKLTYGVKHHSPAARDECKERTILLDGFSKAYAMTGWRLGYCVGPRDVIAKMALLLETTVSCTTSFVQKGGVAALKGPQDSVRAMRDQFRERRDAIVAGLNSVPNVSCIVPDGAFYAFPNITKTGMTSEQFSEHLLNDLGIAALPGTAFGPGGEGYVRFSYATSLESIEKAIGRMKKDSF